MSAEQFYGVARSSAASGDERLSVSDGTGSSISSDEFAGFSHCDAPAPVWQNFYHNEWNLVKDTYFDPAALADFDNYEHKYDAHICSPDDLDLALKGMASSLNNQWTKYTTAKEQQAHEDQIAAGLVPGGFELASTSPGQFHIEFIHYGSPAQSSPLRTGDVVRSIDGQDLSSLTLTQAKALQMGHSGGTMQVAAEHEGKAESVQLALHATPAEQIETKQLPDNIGYVRLPDFIGESRIADFVKQLDSLNKQTPGGLKGLVLDLRNDPGGDLPEAVTVASLFLPDNKVVARQFVRSQNAASFGAMKERDLRTIAADAITLNGKPVDSVLVNALRKLPLAVVINGSSASAAEVLTGALKDNGRAEIVGSHSFGKGVGYKTERLPTGGVLGITQMKYLTPNNFDLSHRGIAPTVAVESNPGELNDGQMEAAVKILKNKQTSDTGLKNGR